jgi:hypothetical protein
MKRPAIIILAVIFLAIAFIDAQAGCVALTTRSEQKAKEEPVYSATEILDVDVWILFHPGTAKQYADDHAVQVRFFTPTGSLYQTIDIPFTSDAKKKGKEKSLDGYPHPIQFSLLKEITWSKGKYLGTSVRLPVAGTMIMSNGLYGGWRAEAYVDGEEVPCAKAVEFTINP